MAKEANVNGKKQRISLEKIRQAVADYMRSEGCGCCSDYDAHKGHKNKLGKLLKVEHYEDISGYDFSKYQTP